MDNLVDNIKNDRLYAFMLGQIGFNNKPEDFVMGESVIIMNPIDHWDSNKIKRGMTGHIDNIMHRYKGEPAEHHEFWVSCDTGRGRFEVGNILKYTEVEQFVKEWKPPV